jgi:exonuclease SbcD
MSERVVLEALVGLKKHGREVVVVAGNHDHPVKWDAYRPILAMLGITVVGSAREARNGGAISFYTRKDEKVNIALMPFLPKRMALPSDMLVGADQDALEQSYNSKVASVAKNLSQFFSPDAVNISTGHLAVVGGKLDGTEREAQSILDYVAPPSVFPPSHYIALGHLHRAQKIRDSATPMWYAGSIVQGNFGEERNTPQVIMVECSPGLPVNDKDIQPINLSASRDLLTIKGRREEILKAAESSGNSYLRVIVEDDNEPGIVNDILGKLEYAVDVTVAENGSVSELDDVDTLTDKSPIEMLTEYLGEREYSDDAINSLVTLFGELSDESGDEVMI